MTSQMLDTQRLSVDSHPQTRIDIGLVLGGGGARGLAHLGVLKALEELNLRPIAISGCSMGAVIGALYSAGNTIAEMEAIADHIEYRKLIYFGEYGGMIGWQGIEALLQQYLPQSFADLSIPLSMTAVDVQAGQLVILRDGELVTAVRASSALPGILSPVKYQGRYLIDGGLLNNLPVDIIRVMTLAPVIAVDVAAPPNRQLNFEPEQPTLFDTATALMTGKTNPFDQLLKRNLTIELFMKAFDIPQRVINEMRINIQPPELLIRPPLDAHFGIESFHRANEIIETGYNAAKSSIAAWLNAYSIHQSA